MLQNRFRKIRQSFRGKRYQKIKDMINLNQETGLILDLGGGPASFFAERYPEPEKVILLEISPELAKEAQKKLPGLQIVIADGEHMPFAKQSLAVTVCNSVIEHVQQPDDLASEIQRVSQSFFLQTPNGKFPVETHSFVGIPFYNLIPFESWKRFVCKLFGANYQYVASVTYIPEVNLRRMFPNAIFEYERFLGLRKSYYVYYNKE